MNNLIEIGNSIPDFQFNATNGNDQKFNSLLGQVIVLYFYPKDNTSGCTAEAEDFREHFPQFKKHKALILGISRDSIKSHQNFIAKLQLPFDLISDQDEKICQLFSVIKPKIMYGKKVKGIERSTFLIDRKGILQNEWRKVNVKDHVQEVLAKVKEIS